VTFDLDAIVARHGRDPVQLLPILHDVMAAEGHVAPPVITAVAAALGVPRGQVEGVVGFYGFFSDTPRGRYRVLFSDNITDELAGSHALRQRLLDAFGVRLGEGQPRRPGVDRRDELHRPVRSRAGAPGQRPRDRPPDAGAHRRDRVAHPRRHAGRVSGPTTCS
jgi:hypothetical protein